MPVNIPFQDINLGGISDSKYQGVANSMYAMVGLDIHSEPGIIKVNQKLTKESGTTITDFINVMVPCSDGSTYMFGDTGKIYKRTSGGTYTNEATASGAITGAMEYNGYIYYARSGYLGRWQLGTAWSTRNDTYGTFTNGSAYHPMHTQNLVLYIGDKNYVAQVENNAGTHTFTANALDLESQYTIKSLGEISTDLLIGTYTADNVSKTRIFRWNTWSVSFSSSDAIPETGINSFLTTDNFVLVQAGSKGNIYVYNGESLERFKRIPGTWTGSSSAQVRMDASDNYLGLPLFGLSYVGGYVPVLGVYSHGSYSKNYPDVLNMEYVLSTANITTSEIGSIKVVGNDILVAWRDGVTYGVDKVDWSNKYSGAYFETRQINTSRDKMKATAGFMLAYRSLPAGTTITVSMSVNYGAYAAVTTTIDTVRKIIYNKKHLPAASSIRFKVSMTASVNDAPEIESFNVTA